MGNLTELVQPGPMPAIPTAEAIEALRAEPRFRQAAAAAAANSVEYYQGRWLAHRVLNDRARFVMASVMLYLHFNRRDDVANSGLTATRLREICVGVGLCSGGRVEAMLLMMRAAGFLERAEDAGDLRVRRYVPTAKLLDLNRDRQRRVLEAIDVLRGGTAYARICGESELELYRRFVVAMGTGFLSGFRVVQPAPVLIRIIDRDVGLPLMMCVFLTSPEYSELCPEALRNVSVAALARRFKVSRVHVRSVLRAAESARLLLRNEETAQVRVLPPLVTAIENFFANAFLFAESCAQIALTETA
jgi:hypothetical protein